jgi:hypothetical protein
VGKSEVVEKFRSLSEKVLGAEKTNEVCDIVLHMEKAPDLAALLHALCPPGAAS